MENLSRKLWHHLAEEDVLAALKSHHQEGLDTNEAAERLRLFGPNAISSQATQSPLKRFLLQFHNPLIYILLVAGVVTLLLSEYIDSSVIFAVVFINAIVGFMQESRAESAINSLRKMLSSHAMVIRNGQKMRIPATELVPGDLIALTTGDKVPADARLIQVRDLQIDESALTGESVPVLKECVRLDQDTILADRINMAYASTLVTYGQAEAVIIATGDDTETGRIASMISSAVSLETPLTKKIHSFSQWLLWIILALAGLTFIAGLFHGASWVDNFMAAIALAVAAIPEGLPAVVTITLAIGVRRMASRHAIIRKLPAVETLGSTTIICSDKTGTLTENQMTVQQLWTQGAVHQFTGTGYDPTGSLSTTDDDSSSDLPVSTRQCLLAGVLCNDSHLVQKDSHWQVEGDPTEGALITSAIKAGLDREQLVRQHKRLDVIPFESDRQYMATMNVWTPDQHIILLKGSLEQILKRCCDQLNTDGQSAPLAEKEIIAAAEHLASQGLRVLALAQCLVPSDQTNLDAFRQQEQAAQLSFTGLQAMIDPPRQEAIEAVRHCQAAGIQVKMITGDHALTAQAIARQIGILPPSEAGSSGVLTGQQLATLSDHALLNEAQSTAVFARVAPEQKLKLVTALQAREQVVAMTGDGVNDAPALKQADIGVAMGITGTEVAKEAADMVLTDDNFASIAAAVEEGRNVFDNLVKFISWILPTNIGQGLVILVAVVLGLTLPVLPVQALWLNMTTAIFLGLALAFEPKESGLMDRPPRQPNSPILSTEMVSRILTLSTLLLAGAFGLFQWSLSQGQPEEVARTLAVTLFVVVQSVFLFNCRSLSRSVLKTPAFSNPWIWVGIAIMSLAQLAFIYSPWMNLLFQSAPLAAEHWLLMLSYGFFVLLFIEGEKTIWRSRHQKTAMSN